MEKNKRNFNICKKLISALCACILIFSIIATTAYAEEPSGKTIKVGYMLLENFQEQQTTVSDGNQVTIRSGYGYDYLQAIRNYTGWNYEYIVGNWELILGKLERGEIDIISHVARTPEREEKFLFSNEPQGYETHYLYVDATNTTINSGDYSALDGKTIGVIKRDLRTPIFLAWCEEQGIQVNTKEYPNPDTLFAALHLNKVDAVSASGLSAAASYDGKCRAIARFDDIPVYFAVKAGEEGEELLAELNAAHSAILDINKNFGIDLQNKYKAENVNLEPPMLTEAEIAAIASYGTIKVGYCDNRRPLAYKDENGELSGLLSDYLKKISEEYGIKFKTYAYDTGNELLAALQNREVHIISPIGYNYGIAEASDLIITNPLTIETMLAVYKGYAGSDPKDIFEAIAILDNSITEKDYATRYYPNAVWVKADTIGEAIELVSNNKAGCYIIRSSTWSWYKNEYSALSELQVLTLPNSNNVTMALHEDDRVLLPILNKGISLLSEADVNRSIVTYSNAAEDVTWLTLIERNPLSFVVTLFLFILIISFIIVLFRASYRKKHLLILEEANKRAESARIEAERANRAKSTFLTSMSHDIRTPMNAIIGMTTLAGKHIGNPEYVKNCLNKVTLASEHLLTLINDVLDINKIETGNLSLSPSVFSLADSIMNLANIGRHQLAEKKHRFEIRVHNVKAEYLFADELRINQVFINLLSNAVKYTPPSGSITIDVKEENIPNDSEKIRLIYSVADTGIGMSEEFQAHMYELFTMANKNTRTITGSGVGLSICKQLVNLMEGTIECESKLGEGTKFTVTLELPVADRAMEDLILPPMKLLLVDDDEVFLETATETLKELGLSPDCVSSGEKAVETVKKNHSLGRDYPLIIIDWKMPDMDGIETTRRIRAEVGEDVSIIVISAYAPEDIRDAAIAAGANGFISKPFFRSSVYKSIKEILDINNETTEEDVSYSAGVSGMNVLIAEDNDLNWEIAHELLAMYKVKTTRAENGKDCLDILESSGFEEYDAVLMDIQMPVMNGYETTRTIKKSDRSDIRTIPVIAMTANAYTEDVMLCAEAGMNYHIPKPIDMEKLLTVLAEVRRN